MDYPTWPRDRAVRLGALAVAVIITLAVTAVVVHQRREAWWHPELPVPTSAVGLAESRSKLLRWTLWSYHTAEPAEAIEAFYDTRLPQGGWRREGLRRVGRAQVLSYARGRGRLEVRLGHDDQPGLAVSLLLTDVPTPQR